MNEIQFNEHEMTGNYGEVFVDPTYMREFIAKHPECMRKRFVVTDETTGKFIMAVYAERFELTGIQSGFTGAQSGNFFVGGDVIASVELNGVVVGDSGGRAWDRKGQIVARVKHELKRLSEFQACQ